jgi:hypothetical protein
MQPAPQARPILILDPKATLSSMSYGLMAAVCPHTMKAMNKPGRGFFPCSALSSCAFVSYSSTAITTGRTRLCAGGEEVLWNFALKHEVCSYGRRDNN